VWPSGRRDMAGPDARFACGYGAPTLHEEAATDLKDGCEREPVHIPGSIQPHGVLLVLNQADELILQAAGDVGSFLGFDEQVRGRALNDVLGHSLSDLMASSGATLQTEPTYIGTIVTSAGAPSLALTAHLVDAVAVVEVEHAVEPRAAPALLASIRAITERIGGASSLLEAANIAADEVRVITGYDRVMIYQFLPDGSGSVIAEVKAVELSSFLRHRFPASDIPPQARALYCRSPIRVIPDVDYVPAPLTPSSRPDTGSPLDMSHCALRSVSPVHIEYLRNMGVGASMSVSVLLQGELWGLVACHNTRSLAVGYEARELCRHVAQILAQKIQAFSEVEMHCLSRDLGYAADRLLRELVDTDDPSSVLLARSAALQEVVQSSGVAISWRGAVKMAGHVPTTPEVQALADWLRTRLSGGNTLVSEQLSEQYPAAARFARSGSGVLSTLMQGDDPPLLIWFRAEKVEEINWAGNPHQPLDPSSRLGSLNPRRSFATWAETVKGRSRPWRPAEIDTVCSFGRRLAPVLQQQRVRELNTLLRQANDQLAALARTDGLTGLANRRAFDERLEHEWARARGRSTPLSLITFDLDFFKQYNDHFGHPDGDTCLRQVSHVIAQERRSTGLLARVGGEEFSILLPETDLQGALIFAEDVRLGISALQLSHPKSTFGVVTASFGVAVQVPGVTSIMKDLVQAADAALYAAKAAGRNRVVSA
jgi:chemotaxis family two-component system sensor kinase Cph1